MHRSPEDDEVKDIVKREMEKAEATFLKDVPRIAEIKVSETWENKLFFSCTLSG